MLRERFAPLWAFLLAQRGQYETFQIVLPAPYGTPRGTWAGSPAVDGGSQTGRSINLDGFSAGATIKAGDLFKFANHSKVYIATADAVANGSGQVAGLAIEPALMTSPADGEALTSSSVPFTMALSSDIGESSVMPGGIFSFQLELLEVY